MNMDSDPGIQEQAFHMVRHIADAEEGAELVFEGLGDQALLGSISHALDSDNEDVVRQVRYRATHAILATCPNTWL